MMLRAFGDRKCVSGGSYIVNGSGKFDDVTVERLKEIKKLSVRAIWYTGIIAHASKTVFRDIQNCNSSLIKGKAGSPYAIRDYYDVDPALATSVINRMSEFENLIKRTHDAGMKVIIDFVPNHVYRAYSSEKNHFGPENFYLLNEDLHLPSELKSNYRESPAKATGNNCFSPYPSLNDWYETVKLNYENRDTWYQMFEILKFWAAKGVDGFRCDMVEMVPVEFFGWVFPQMKKIFPDIKFIAEVYKKENYQIYSQNGDFDFLYDKSGMYDTLIAILEGKESASLLTSQWQFLGNLQYKMLNFLENHDEQRLASDFIIGSGKKALPALIVSLFFNTAPFMIYFGQEFGERGMEKEGFSSLDGRTSIYDYCIVPSIKRWIQKKLNTDEIAIYKEYCNLLKIATVDDIFTLGKTFDLGYVNPASEYFNPDKQFAFLRAYNQHAALIVVNFDNKEVNVRVNIPEHAFEYLNIKQTKDINSSNSVPLKIAQYNGVVNYI